VGALDDDDEFRAVDALADACGICWAELLDVIRVIALLDEGLGAKPRQRACWNAWPPRAGAGSPGPTSPPPARDPPIDTRIRRLARTWYWARRERDRWGRSELQKVPQRLDAEYPA
jgi:hypothetical protein